MTVSLSSMKIWEGRHLLILLELIPQVEIRINIKESRQQQGLNFKPLLLSCEKSSTKYNDRNFVDNFLQLIIYLALVANI